MVLLTLSYPCNADTPAPAPPVFQALYTSLETYLQTFNTTLSTGDGTAYPVLYSGTLTKANANTGPQLLNATYLSGLQLQLQDLKATGVQSILIQVGFPMLYEPYLTSQGQSQAAFVSFYQQVAALVRAQGMKLIIENDTLLATDVQTGWTLTPFYQSLDWTAYQQARAQTALTIEQTMQPDYLVVLEEPDTEAWNTGQSSVNTPSGANAMLGQILSGLQTYRQSGLKVGAGVGSWLYTYKYFIQDFVTQPMDFIDMHIYPVNLQFLPNALSIANIAAAAGMPVAMTECWLNKVGDTELKVLTDADVRARNPFYFWAPLDAYFLKTMANFANYTKMLFVAPSNSEYYWAYLPYDSTTKNMDPPTIISEENSASSANVILASYTTTAMHFYHTTVARPDKTPPSAATELAGTSGNPTTAYLTWAAATDDVGVAGYHILRNGALVGTASTLYFQDSGLTEGTSYSYTVQAFDLAGNVSASTPAIQVRTKEVTPPTPPANPAATVISRKQINLTWSPSSDNAGITYYLVFQGSSPNNLSQVAQTSGANTSVGIYYLNPGTTYYFALQAQDPWGNLSKLSTVVSATTLP